MNDLIIYFNELTDTRDSRGLKHELTDCIVMTIFGILAGHYDAENIAFFLKLNEEYFNKELNLKYGTPSPDTLLRIYSLIDPEEFMKIFVKWVENIVKEKNEQLNNKYKLIPIDGKAIKSATDKINGGNTPYIVSAFLQDLGISIAGIKVDDKSNEITAIPELLDLINIENCIITIDSIGCQKNIARKIVEKGGHYCLAVKENKKNFYLDIKDYFDYIVVDKNFGVGLRDIEVMKQAEKITFIVEANSVSQRKFICITEALKIIDSQFQTDISERICIIFNKYKENQQIILDGNRKILGGFPEYEQKQIQQVVYYLSKMKILRTW